MEKFPIENPHEDQENDREEDKADTNSPEDPKKKKGISRRSFLKIAGGAIAAAVGGKAIHQILEVREVERRRPIKDRLFEGIQTYDRIGEDNPEHDKLFESFPETIPGVSHVLKHHVPGAKRIIVHILQMHEVKEMPDDLKKKVQEVQDNIYDIVNNLSDHGLMKEVCDEGSTVEVEMIESAFGNFQETLEQIDEQQNAVVQQEIEILEKEIERVKQQSSSHQEEMQSEALTEIKDRVETLQIENDVRQSMLAEYDKEPSDGDKTRTAQNIESIKVLKGLLDDVEQRRIAPSDALIKVHQNKIQTLKSKIIGRDTKEKKVLPKKESQILSAAERLKRDGKVKVRAAELIASAQAAEQEAEKGFWSMDARKRESLVYGLRENVALEIASRSTHTVTGVIYGGYHEFIDNIHKWNEKHPDKGYSLVEVIPETYYAHQSNQDQE